MSSNGPNQFGRPMRPDRIEMICDAANAIVGSERGERFAAESDNYNDFLACVTWSIYDALAEQLPDTMIAEIQAGLAEADPVCRAAYGS